MFDPLEFFNSSRNEAAEVTMINICVVLRSVYTYDELEEMVLA